MKINKRLFRKSVLTAALVAVVGMAVSCSDLWSEQHPGTYYVNSGETVASFLENHPSGEFSEFVTIIKKAGIWGEMRTYGDHTCFAPDNAAVESYLAERMKEAPDSIKHYFESVESLPVYICDSIAKTHLCYSTFYCSDMSGDGAFPYPNLLDRFLTYFSFPDTIWSEDLDTFTVKLAFKVNQQSRIVEADDSVQNGVVHIIDKVLRPSNKFLPGHLKENNMKAPYRYQATIFYDAIIATHLKDSLEKYIDITYPEPAYDSTYACLQTTGKCAVEYETAYETGDSKQRAIWPAKRYFKFTLFAVTDSILENDYGIHNLAELRQKAIDVYGGAELPDSVPQSPLYKLISYHILPCWMTYNQLNTSQSELVNNRSAKESLDIEDFYETMHPYAVMRISTPLDPNVERKGIYINRKGTVSDKNLEYPGIRIWTPSEYENLDPTCSNGGYHFIDKMLFFDTDTKNVLRTRMRYMANTLSPDFINSGARGRMKTPNSKSPTDHAVYGFKKGFVKNVECNDAAQFYVRYRDATFGCFYGDEMTIRGIYDIIFRLPPVPEDGTYEVRIWGNSLGSTSQNDRGIAQFYFREGNYGEFNPCGIPVNLGVKSITEPQIGAIMDDQFEGTDEEKEQQMLANDKAMRNRGYMKAMDSYCTSSHSTKDAANSLRADKSCFRKILCTEYMKAGTDYYIRLRQVLQNESAVCPFNILEIVPKDVYDGAIPEDRH